MFNQGMYSRQRALQKALCDLGVSVAWLEVPERPNEATHADFMRDKRRYHITTCMQLIKEVTELLDCYPWKSERSMVQATREVLLDELVDVFKFFMNLLILHGVLPEEFQRAYDEKSQRVEKRLLGAELPAHTYSI